MSSQYGEDVYIAEALKGVDKGTLIEIGAWDPITFSNSQGLIEAGWKAILIEPVPFHAEKLIRYYANNPGVRVISAAIGVEGGLMDMAVTEDAVSQQWNQAQAGPWKEEGGFYGRVTVPVLAVSDFFRRFGGDFQMISVDTEGTSCAVFSEMMRVGVRPRCVIVEHDGGIVELAPIYEAANYQQVHLNGTNVVLRWTGK